VTKSLDFIVLGLDDDLVCQGANVDGESVVNITSDDPEFGAYLDRDGIDALIAWLEVARDWVS
jgi:hypothetical protein